MKLRLSATSIRRLLAAMTVVCVAAVAILIARGRPEIPHGENSSLPGLPPDVAGMMEGYRFNEEIAGRRIEISGRRAVNRGRSFLGLRSTVARATFLDTLSGSWRFKGGEVRFRADAAEWGLSHGAPLVLRKGVSVRLNGGALDDVASARLFLTEGVLETYGEKKRVYRLK
uniref:Lipopolysaccharide ABC transporter, periplasmic protein LptC n=1 Tax=Geobacter metallireducens TaxID=28232 RepID=A0A831UA30_GEOME